MTYRLSAFVFVSAVLAAQIGCGHTCGSRPGLFTSNTHKAPCGQTMGRTGGCFDAATGQPMPCPPDIDMLPGGTLPAPGGLIPGGSQPMELPMPGSSDTIPPAGVPSRPPARPEAAPPPVLPLPGNATLPYPTSPGVPVKSGSNK